MKQVLSIIGVTSALLIGGVAMANVETVKASSPNEMMSLEGFLGTWSAHELQVPGPWGPGYERDGVLTETMGPGGHSHLIQYELTSNGKLVGAETVTWDPAEQKFIGYAFSDNGPGAFITKGTWDGADFVYLGQLAVPGHNISVRKVLTEILKDSYTIRIYSSFDGGPYALVTETKLTRN